MSQHTTRPAWHDHLSHLLHHFLVALTLASTVFVLEQNGLLNWLDSISLRAVGAISARESIEGDPRLEAAPRALLIGDRYFEGAFRQESPLDRQEMARMVEGLRAMQPRLLAFDIDLSPGPKGSRGSEGQEILDRQLVEAVKQGIPVIVTTPFQVVDEGLLLHKHAWMATLCGAGVQFALPHLPISQGVVLRYAHQQATLGVVARAAMMPSTAVADSSICSLVKQGPEASVFLDKAFPPGAWVTADKLSAQRPINPDYLKHAAGLILKAQATPGASDASFFKDRPIFIGAGFDSRDEFLTPYGTFGGTVVHAATFFSEQNPARAVTHGVAIALDLVFGVLAGFLFGAVWSRANQAQLNHEAQAGSLPRWLRARAWQAAAFATLAGWLVILFLSSAWLFRHDLWNNPGPMLIGVFAKTLIASRHGLKQTGPSEHGPAATSWVSYLDWLLVSPIIVWAAVLFISH